MALKAYIYSVGIDRSQIEVIVVMVIFYFQIVPQRSSSKSTNTDDALLSDSSTDFQWSPRMHQIIFVGLTCLICGCTTIEHKSLDKTSNDELMGKTIQASLYEAPSFIAHTTTSGLATATGGLLGGLAGASGAAIYGNQIVEQ